MSRDRPRSFSDSALSRGRLPSIQPTSKRKLTLCVVGSGGVGKSSLTVRYLQGQFPEYYDPTVEESYITQIEYGFDQHDVEIIDTAGQEEFMLFRDSSLAKGDAFLAIFAINSPESWYDVQKLRRKIIQENDDDETIPIVIIANKSDLDPEESRQVKIDEVLEYCKRCNCPLLETSAKTGLNVTESFRLLLDRISELRPSKFKDSILALPDEHHLNDRNKCVVS
uniref:Rap1-like n=1 Tax=Suberites domuncula TaxID=55567 RepID=A1XKQ9_SUBDO|nr:Rap1-like [Suberites domuncula]